MERAVYARTEITRQRKLAEANINVQRGVNWLLAFEPA